MQNFSQIKFLVIDEADRMVRQGSFPQLARILEAVDRANPMEDEGDSDDNGMEHDESMMSQEQQRLRGLPGLPGEAKVTMLSPDLLKQLQQQKQEAQPNVALDTVDDDDVECNDTDEEDEDEDSISLPGPAPVVRQTFIYSATMTLPSSTSSSAARQAGGKTKQTTSRRSTIDGAIAEILEKAHAKGKTKIFDLTSNDLGAKKMRVHENAANLNGSSKVTDTKPTATSTAFCLPSGLQLQHIRCTQRHKDSHLYAYLMTTVDGSKGPALVFCNSVAAVRRVGGLLQTLGLAVRLLHAQMQQVREKNCVIFCLVALGSRASREEEIL